VPLYYQEAHAVKAKIIRQEWSAEELDVRLEEERQRLFNLFVQRQAQELENTEEVKRAVRDIARILTVANERKRLALSELGEQEIKEKITELNGRIKETAKMAGDRGSRVSKGRVKALKREMGELKAVLFARESK